MNLINDSNNNFEVTAGAESTDNLVVSENNLNNLNNQNDFNNLNNFIVEINNLTKKYNNILALDDVSIKIPKGKIVGLLGPNGSGKTTLMKILAGLICNYKGEVLIDNYQPNDYTKSIIKVFKDFFADFDEEKMQEMLKQLGLDVNQKIKTMSKGTIEKLQLCLAMSRKSLLYILDEPLGGVDPATRDYILDTIIRNYNPAGTVIISTHLIEDVEKIFDMAVFLNKGKITLFEDVDSVKEKYNKSINELFREEFKCF